MTLKRFFILGVLLFVYFGNLSAQEDAAEPLNTLSLEAFMSQIKLHHPIAKQAELRISEGEANLLKMRGAFDPILAANGDRKLFKDTEYYQIFDATFKIPTWYGIELKADYENNSGEFLNPQLSVPDDGLLSAGISISVLDGLLINDRMANLKKAKIFRNQTKAERDLEINQLLYQAASAYFDWLKAYQNTTIYQNYLNNTKNRFEGIKKSVIAGDMAAIDSVEAKINWQNRKIDYNQAALDLNKKRLLLSNFLWIESVPLELQENVVPTVPSTSTIAEILQLDQLNAISSLENHPYLQIANYKVQNAVIDRRLRRNQLLPDLQLEYNFLTEDFEQTSSFNTNNYKAGFTFKMPLFLRKERGELRLSNYRLQHLEWDRDLTQLSLKNNIEAARLNLSTLETQASEMTEIVSNTQQLLNAEQRKFDLGDSSLFLLINRERTLLATQLKEVDVRTSWFKAHAQLFKDLGVVPE